jgi:carboxyl-terminal processing protease
VSNRTKTVAALLAVAMVFSLGYVLGSLQGGNVAFSDEFIQRSGEISAILTDHYYLGVDDATLEDGMLHGLAQSVGDPYTRYLNEAELKAYTDASAETYVGIGVLISLNDAAMPTVIRVYRNSPAERGGVQAGDVITAVDDYIVEPGTDLSEVSRRLRGVAGTEVFVTLNRGGEAVSLTLTRAAVEIEYVESRMLSADIGYIALSEFSIRCHIEVKEAIASLQSRGMKKLVFDLRGNPGGYVDSAVAIADIFLDEGLVAYTVYADGTRHDYESNKEKLDIPVVTLVDGNSASASEIVVGALKDRGVAKVIGMQTYGKGIIQMLYALSEGGGLNVTIASYYTPNGTSIHGTGIAPDVEIALPEAVLNGTQALTPQNDTQLIGALDYLKQQP